MDRRAFLGALALLATPRGVAAQPAGRPHRIGYLGTTSAAASSRFVEAFREGLRELGWPEGQGIVIDYRFAGGQFDRLGDLAAELVRLKVEAIVAGPTPAGVAAKNATGTIPIIMVAVGDPVRLGLVASLGRPGGNVTGLSFDVGQEFYGKGLELLKEIAPRARRVAVLWNSSNPAQELAVRYVEAAAGPLRLQLQRLPVRGQGDLDPAFQAMRNESADALLVVPDSMFNLHRTRLADLAVGNRLPSMHGFRELAEAGGLMSYGPNLADVYRRAATFVDKILKGARPADLPVEQPTKFELVINLKTAKALGLTIPPSLLARADQVIE